MSEQPRTTVCFRLLIDPELGTTKGNTVLVGMDVEYGDQLAPLVFDGLPRRIEQVREVLDGVIARWGLRFSTRGKTTARDLDAAMDASDVKPFAPTLVAGAEIIARDKPAAS